MTWSFLSTKVQRRAMRAAQTSSSSYPPPRIESHGISGHSGRNSIGRFASGSLGAEDHFVALRSSPPGSELGDPLGDVLDLLEQMVALPGEVLDGQLLQRRR